MKIRKSIWLSLIATLALAVIAMLFVDTVPPHSMTHGSMHMAKRRVLRFAQMHGKLPSAFRDTEVIDGFHSSLKDGWGVDLSYRVDTNDLVTFQSLGKDHRLGGSGDDTDMVGIFSARRPDGSWSDEFVQWIQDPFDAVRTQKPNQASEATSEPAPSADSSSPQG